MKELNRRFQNTSLGKVAVLLGGNSAEREISLLSGNAVLNALREEGVHAEPFDPADYPLTHLVSEGFSRVFIALHGRFGEDGTIQGALESLRIPYTGSGILGSALSMDKWRTKLLWQAAGIPVPRYHLLHNQNDFEHVIGALGLPLIVKPAREGSSIGFSKVSTRSELPTAYAEAARYDTLILAEEFIAGQELTAAVLGDQALPLVRIQAPQGNYDYQNKYFTEETRYFCPAGIPAELENTIQSMVLRAFQTLGCRGWGRADLILTPEGKFYFLEMNTSPGMTAHSLVPMAARAAGLSFGDLCLRILATASLESNDQIMNKG